MADREIAVDGLALSGEWQERVLIDRLVITAPEGSVSASGELSFQDSLGILLNLDAQLDPVLTGHDSDISVTADVEGPLSSLEVSLASPQFGAFVNAALKICNVLVSPTCKLTTRPSRPAVPAWWTGRTVSRCWRNWKSPAPIHLFSRRSGHRNHAVSGELALEFNEQRVSISESRLAIDGAETSARIDGVIDSAVRSREWSAGLGKIAVADR